MSRTPPVSLCSTLALAALTLAANACGASRALHAPMAAINEVVPTEREAPPLLVDNRFKRDRMGNVTESDMRDILASPVFLEDRSRVGIVPVATGYGIDEDLPVTEVPGALADALSDTGHFEVVSEVSTDWPSGRKIAGLRELATRYRAEYLLLYRHRFVDRSYTNAWALAYLTVVGAFFAPANTIEIAGVVEATLFDVKTGTLLFTVFERVHQISEENVWQNDRKRRDLKQGLLDDATKTLSANVLDQIQALVAARPEPKRAPKLHAVVPSPTAAARADD